MLDFFAHFRRKQILACTSRGGVVVFVLLTGYMAGSRSSAFADDATPVATVSTVIVPPTVAQVSPEPTSVNLPTVSAERSTPIATSPPLPTDAPIIVPTTARKVDVLPQPTQTPTPIIASSSNPSIPPAALAPLPSPAELQLDARLRWGTSVPADVRRWAFLIVPAARRYGLDPNLIAAVMTMESGGDPLALSPADAHGLMQILHGPWDPKRNVFRGAAMLRRLFDEFHDLTLVLAGYNAGEGAVIAYNGVPPYRETRDYVIVVGYLYELYSHRRITLRQKERFRTTLSDLRRFASQRKKISKLAGIAGVELTQGVGCRRLPGGCDSLSGTSSPGLVSTLDPFWPLAGSPDPLQKVDPFMASSG
ncbi:MAG TPA: transglycosylase SLT domain-containing protein [Chloroflexota bacterium]